MRPGRTRRGHPSRVVRPIGRPKKGSFMRADRPQPSRLAAEASFNVETAAMFVRSIRTGDAAIDLELQDIANRLDRIASRFADVNRGAN
jgi:hypothetical protein